MQFETSWWNLLFRITHQAVECFAAKCFTAKEKPRSKWIRTFSRVILLLPTPTISLVENATMHQLYIGYYVLCSDSIKIHLCGFFRSLLLPLSRRIHTNVNWIVFQPVLVWFQLGAHTHGHHLLQMMSINMNRRLIWHGKNARLEPAK